MKIKDIEFDESMLVSFHFKRTSYNSVAESKTIMWRLELDFKITDNFNFIYENSISLDYTPFDFDEDINKLDNYIDYLKDALNFIIEKNGGVSRSNS